MGGKLPQGWPIINYVLNNIYLLAILIENSILTHQVKIFKTGCSLFLETKYQAILFGVFTMSTPMAA